MAQESTSITSVTLKEERGSPCQGMGSRPPFAFSRRLALSFCLLAFVAIAANLVLIADLSEEMTRLNGNVSSPGATGPAVSAGVAPFTACRNHMAVLLGIMTACFGGMIYLFFRKVVTPINVAAHAVKEISLGNLAVTVPPRHAHDVGGIGKSINEVAANFQEVLLLTGTTVGNLCSGIERVEGLLSNRDNPTSEDEVRQEMQAIKDDLEMLNSVVKDFRFYQTCFQNGKVIPTGKK